MTLHRKTSTLQRFAHALLLAAVLPLGVMAQETTQSYTTRAGDTLEKVAMQQFRDSPLKPAWVAQRLQESNAAGLGPIRIQQKLKAGTVLELPTHEALLRQAAGPLLQDQDNSASNAKGESSRKNWVRFP